MYLVVESWQSGNATDSKSVEPAYTGAQVQILYSPYEYVHEKFFKIRKTVKPVFSGLFVCSEPSQKVMKIIKLRTKLRTADYC